MSLHSSAKSPNTSADRNNRRFAVHGLAVELRCGVKSVQDQITPMLAPFAVEQWPDGFIPLTGYIQPFSADVPKHLPATATALAVPRDVAEIYQENERFWLVDDRWGLLELNTLRGQWRSWLLPAPALDSVRLAEMAILWPMAQLLKAKRLFLIPAVSVVRDGIGFLILSPFGIEAELTALVRSGYRVIGQRWTAIREEDGRLAMLHMPGLMERTAAPRLRAGGIETQPTGWFDLHQEHLGSQQNHAFCDAVLIADPGRRPTAQLRPVGHSAAVNILRRAWPLVDLQPQRRSGQLPVRLANACKCFELQLSREPLDLLRLLDGLRRKAAPASKPVQPPIRLPFNTERAIAV